MTHEMTPGMPPASFQTRPLYLAWLAALALCLLFFLWAFFALSPQQRAEDRAGTRRAGLLAEEPAAPVQELAQQKAAPAPPAFDLAASPRLITAFSLSGLYLMDDALPVFSIRAPGSRFAAQVIVRDTSPKVLVREITVNWQLEAPEARADLAGVSKGLLAPDAESPAFLSEAIPLPALSDGQMPAPYPTLLVRAKDKPEQAGAGVGAGAGTGIETDAGSGDKPEMSGVGGGTDAGSSEKPELSGAGAGAGDSLTRLVLPVSAEMGCRACHGGPWKHEPGFGLSRETAVDILEVHDKRNGSRLMKQAEKGPVDCHSCHADSEGPLKAGDPPGLSAAMHGFHAAMGPQGAEVCGPCHAVAPDGESRLSRDLHAMWGLDCASCHGDLADHAISLLKHEAGRGSRAAAARLERLAHLSSRQAADIAPRQPGRNLPHCSGCHDFKVKPEPGAASAFNKWTASREERFTQALDDSGQLRCPSCHGTPHALYPAGAKIDNLQPMQYQNLAAPLGAGGNCAVCHTVDMDYFIHHERPE